MWEELFGKIGWWVIPVIIITWIARELWGIRKNHNQVKLTILAEKRAAMIQDFHSKLVEVESKLEKLYYLYMPVGSNPPVVDPGDTIREARSLKDLALKLKVFFPKELSNKMIKMCQLISEVADLFDRRELLITNDQRGTPEEIEIEQAAIKKLKEGMILKIKSELERDFQHLLRVK